jgi:ubiquinone/menaquinone biosynthesis C-methylase UbiE
MELVELRPGETVLEVGCGTGAIDRWLAQRTHGANPITGIDINRYLLKEARALVAKDGLEDIIAFREGNGEALELPDNSFDVTLSLTVLEEADADRMLAEIVRVTRPGESGRDGASARYATVDQRAVAS